VKEADFSSTLIFELMHKLNNQALILRIKLILKKVEITTKNFKQVKLVSHRLAMPNFILYGFHICW